MIDTLSESVILACHWIKEISQTGEEKPANMQLPFPYDNWKGAVREYNHREKKWIFFGPVWHTGQAVKSLVAAHRLFPTRGYLDSALAGAAFIERNQLTEGPDRGLILTYEGRRRDVIGLPGILEASDGLIELASYTKDNLWWDIVLEALDWIIRKAYISGEGHIRNIYEPVKREFQPYTGTTGPHGGKPTLDGGIFIKAYQYTGKKIYRDVAVEIAERLLKDEDPPGNWIDYGPSSREKEALHPRHAYWYGFPMILMYDITGEDKYLQQAFRSAEWYAKALRHDGGFFRGTYTGFRTDSFGHASSGTACALIFWTELYRRFDKKEYLPYMSRALQFLLNMQVRESADPNMKGAVIEKVLPPEGTDASPYMVRDLASIFFVQAACMLLENREILGFLSVKTPTE
jgi:hypothetical protein